ncbi:hypothetical protein [Actinoallomurus rhizosphaericola]|uniref:hypothetical protein n=1 Tax=Actinoallomurus rhizosphaericola TaxID=2952536 RepID=UPI002091BCE6|nr:hypothetical protein [Actinoallomurus rhizosphaericola]MCO5992676.1 hypothetical protein [Actinoallomurus rhizosphaericola]
MLHFIITLSFPQRGMTMSTSSGNFNTKPGMTRVDVFEAIYKMACEQAGLSGGNVMFFSLEPNELPVA